MDEISPFIFGDFSKISERQFTICTFCSPKIILFFDLRFFGTNYGGFEIAIKFPF